MSLHLADEHTYHIPNSRMLPTQVVEKVRHRGPMFVDPMVEHDHAIWVSLCTQREIVRARKMLEADLVTVLKTGVFAFVTLFPIVNPLGDAPIFVQLTQGAALADCQKIHPRAVLGISWQQLQKSAAKKQF